MDLISILDMVGEDLHMEKIPVDLPVGHYLVQIQWEKYEVLGRSDSKSKWKRLSSSEHLPFESNESYLKQGIADFSTIFVIVTCRIISNPHSYEDISICAPKELVGIRWWHKTIFTVNVKLDLNNGDPINYAEIEFDNRSTEEIDKEILGIITSDDDGSTSIPNDQVKVKDIKFDPKDKKYFEYLTKHGKEFGYQTIQEFSQSRQCIDTMESSEVKREAESIYIRNRERKLEKAMFLQKRYENLLADNKFDSKREFDDRKVRWASLQRRMNSEYNIFKSDLILVGTYIIVSIPTLKAYIGSSTNINKRIENHLRLLKKKDHHSFKLQEEFDKYGEDSFQILILYVFDEGYTDNIKRYIKDLEQSLIDKYRPELNVRYDIDWKP